MIPHLGELSHLSSNGQFSSKAMGILFPLLFLCLNFLEAGAARKPDASSADQE
ncbi:hypothetical protein KR50_29310 [Jeotgalibacillus campisalis]|uniref:Uncharacterized protein n=1 Tax=Jeotgalibacillus campisalis TaxID=220754 RepID=A0A0C2VP82_9BACL|nr:hypothetical protein KR50_29310 [Jeotgalibacillus campisalis]